MSPVALLVVASSLAGPPALRPLAGADPDAPVLALAFAGQDELVVLSPSVVTLYQLRGDELRALARHPVEASGPRARQPGGMLVSEAGTRSLWALASGWPEALLLDTGAGLAATGRAEALPWPGAPRGIRIEPGTGRLDAELPGLGAGPYLALAEGAAVDAAGRLHLRGRGDGEPAMGPPLAALAAGALLSGSTRPPGEPDALLLLHPGDSPPETVLQLPAALRAIAAERRGRRVHSVLALETQPGRSALFAVEWEPAP